MKTKTVRKPRTKKIKLNASNSDIWAVCTGVLDLEKVQNPFNDYSAARMGQVVHGIMESILSPLLYKEQTTHGNVKRYLENQKIPVKDKMLIEENFDEIIEHLEFCINKIKLDIEYMPKGVQIIQEKKMRHITKGYQITGIPDLVLYDGKELKIYDYKFGRVPVLAENNLQLSIYAHLTIKEEKALPEGLDIEGIIIQPKIKNISTAEIIYNKNRLDELYTEPEKRKFVCGRHCMYCPYNDVCKEFKKIMKKFLKPEFMDMTINRIKEWEYVLKYVAPVKKMLDRVEKNMKDYIINGGTSKVFELGTQIGNRQWMNDKKPEAIAKALKVSKSKIVSSKIKTPAQVEKVVKDKKQVGQFVYRSEFATVVFKEGK